MAATGPHHSPDHLLLAVGGPSDAPPPALVAPSPSTVVIAVDGGLRLLARHGIEAHHLVGDLDSLAPAEVAAAIDAGATLHRHEPDKDATDLELALRLAVELAEVHEIPTLEVVGPGGGRLDLLLVDLLLLAAPWLAPVQVSARFGPATVQALVGPAIRRLRGRPGEQVSLIPVGGPALGVHTTGLRWPLAAADLATATSRAASNELLGAEAVVEVRDGALLVVQPGVLAPPITPRPGPYDPTPRLPGGPIP